MFKLYRNLARRDDEQIRATFQKSPVRLRGLHLKLDDFFSAWFLAWMEEHWGTRWRSRRSRFIAESVDELERGGWAGKPPGWETHIKGAGYKNPSPYCLLAVLRDRKDLKRVSEMPRTLEAQGMTYNILYEWRPTCEGYASFAASDGIQPQGGTTRGTLGGFLQDALTKQDYAVTCGHVAGRSLAHMQSVANPPSKVGIATLWTVPDPSGARSCNNRAFSDANPTPSNPPPVCLDFAAAQIDPADVAVGHIPGVGRPTTVSAVSAMNSRDSVTFFGHTSRRTSAELDALCLWQEIELPDPNNPGSRIAHCFGDIFSICHPRPWYVNTDLARPGDSGAWLVHDSGGIAAWDGMIIAGDGAHAYACFAENIMAYAQAVEPNLILPP